jgi:hypothetical protein
MVDRTKRSTTQDYIDATGKRAILIGEYEITKMAVSASPEDGGDKPIILKAIELILAKPEDIKRETLSLVNKEQKASPNADSKTIRNRVSKKVIQRYSYFTGFVGGASGLFSVIPGLGQAIALVGGASGDIVVTMKFQIEMVMALAVIHDHDILNQEEQRLCFLVAGLGAINQTLQQGGKQLGARAFVNVVRQYLKGSVLVAIKEVFKRVGVTFTRKALEKAIPFGVGIIVGASFNTAFTTYIGDRANYFFSVYDPDDNTST